MMSARSKGLLVLCALVGLACMPRFVRAERDGPHLDLEPWFGYTKFAKNNNFENETAFGGTAGFYPYRYIGIEGFLGKTSPNSEHGTTIWADPVGIAPSVDSDILLYGFNLLFSFRPSAPVNPFVLAGWQEGKFEFDSPGVGKQYANGWQIGGGLKIRVNDLMSVRADVRDLIWKFDSPPAPVPPGEDATDNLLFAGGLEFAIGGHSVAADEDADGIPNHKDKCPGTPAGAKVDAKGCPLDGDHDGVPDGIDQCTDTPTGAKVDTRGCPLDADGDRVPDGIDQCADTPAGAVVDERGCPRDADGDGVPDGIDQCADTPSGVHVDARGCPADADGDGVSDDKDRCPNTPAGVAVGPDGCPTQLTEREIELLDKGRITERSIQFTTGKADILPESYQTLDDIGKILIQYPQLHIEVGGHADARGSDAYNLDLSQRRAESVLSYLTSKFPQINRDQYTAKGYGERVPVASNKTVEGMAKNRRVEFKVLNTEELKKERELRNK
jgi:OOP family OmpA-OmpF porin